MRPVHLLSKPTAEPAAERARPGPRSSARSGFDVRRSHSGEWQTCAPQLNASALDASNASFQAAMLSGNYCGAYQQSFRQWLMFARLADLAWMKLVRLRVPQPAGPKNFGRDLEQGFASG
jgi:hypothetical protein